MFRRNGKKPASKIVIHRDELLAHEVTSVRGIDVTTPARTAFDLGRRGPFVEAVIRVDALGRATRLDPSSVYDVIAEHPGARGLVQLRRVLSVTDAGAESPQETRTRLVLIDGGCRNRRHRSAWTTGASTWAIASSKSASSTTVPSTGRIPSSEPTTSSGTRSCRPAAG